MKNVNNDLNVSIVFFETYDKFEEYEQKLNIFLNLIEYLNNDKFIKKSY